MLVNIFPVNVKCMRKMKEEQGFAVFYHCERVTSQGKYILGIISRTNCNVVVVIKKIICSIRIGMKIKLEDIVEHGNYFIKKEILMKATIQGIRKISLILSLA